MGTIREISLEDRKKLARSVRGWVGTFVKLERRTGQQISLEQIVAEVLAVAKKYQMELRNEDIKK